MKTAILSDIHANLPALQAVLADAKEQGAEEYWLLGDVVDYGASPNEVIEVLQGLPIVHSVGGNHDVALFSEDITASTTPHGKAAHQYTKATLTAGNRAWLQQHCTRQKVVLESLGITLVHGNPIDPFWGYFRPGRDDDLLADMLALLTTQNLCIGHSHLQFTFPLSQGGAIYNPGSVGQPRNGCADAQYALYEEGAFTFRKVPYNIEAAAAAIRAAGLPAYLSDRLFEGK